MARPGAGPGGEQGLPLRAVRAQGWVLGWRDVSESGCSHSGQKVLETGEGREAAGRPRPPLGGMGGTWPGEVCLELGCLELGCLEWACLECYPLVPWGGIGGSGLEQADTALWTLRPLN